MPAIVFILIIIGLVAALVYISPFLIIGGILYLIYRGGVYLLGQYKHEVTSMDRYWVGYGVFFIPVFILLVDGYISAWLLLIYFIPGAVGVAYFLMSESMSQKTTVIDNQINNSEGQLSVSVGNKFAASFEKFKKEPINMNAKEDVMEKVGEPDYNHGGPVVEVDSSVFTANAIEELITILNSNNQSVFSSWIQKNAWMKKYDWARNAVDLTNDLIRKSKALETMSFESALQRLTLQRQIEEERAKLIKALYEKEEYELKRKQLGQLPKEKKRIEEPSYTEYLEKNIEKIANNRESEDKAVSLLTEKYRFTENEAKEEIGRLKNKYKVMTDRRTR